MNNGDSPVMFVYPPEELSDESVHAISDFLHAICQPSCLTQNREGQLS